MQTATVCALLTRTRPSTPLSVTVMIPATTTMTMTMTTMTIVQREMLALRRHGRARHHRVTAEKAHQLMAGLRRTPEPPLGERLILPDRKVLRLTRAQKVARLIQAQKAALPRPDRKAVQQNNRKS